MLPSTSKVQTTAAITSMQFQNLQMGKIMSWGNLFIARVQSRPKLEVRALVPMYDLFNLEEVQDANDPDKLSKTGLWAKSLLVKVTFMCYDDFCALVREVKAGKTQMNEIIEMNQMLNEWAIQPTKAHTLLSLS